MLFESSVTLYVNSENPTSIFISPPVMNSYSPAVYFPANADAVLLIQFELTNDISSPLTLNEEI